MRWERGFSASIYLTKVDPVSWRDMGRYEVVSGSISKTAADLLESADIEMTELPEGGETWIRVWLDAEQDGIEHVPLFTGLVSAPSRDLEGAHVTHTVECYSVLKAVDDILTERGSYIPSEVSAPAAAARLLRSGVAPVEVAETAEPPRLLSAVISEDGETNLTLAWKVLESIGWRIRLDGEGVIHVEPRSDEVVEVFDSVSKDVIELSVSDEQDWYSCPNVLRAISDDLVAVARDDDPESALSTVSRGREVWAEETSVTLGTNESLGAYAIRRLKELQAPARSVSYARRFFPGIYPGDAIRINHPEVGIDGTFRVESQNIDLGYGCKTSEEAKEI